MNHVDGVITYHFPKKPAYCCVVMIVVKVETWSCFLFFTLFVSVMAGGWLIEVAW